MIVERQVPQYLEKHEEQKLNSQISARSSLVKAIRN